MGGSRDERLPDDLQGVAERLARQKVEIDPLRLDELKQRAMAQSTARNGRRTLIRSRLATIVTALALVGGAGGALAISHLDSHPNSHGGAADDQYCEGKHHEKHHCCDEGSSSRKGCPGDKSSTERKGCPSNQSNTGR